MQEMIVSKLSQLFEAGTIDRVVGWKRGETFYDVSPALFESKEALSEFVYNDFCGANLSKFLVKETKTHPTNHSICGDPDQEGKIAVLVKPCDSYSLNQLIKDNRVKREDLYILAIPCRGKVSEEKLRESGVVGMTDCKIEGEELVLDTLYGSERRERALMLHDKCATCHAEHHVIADEVIGETEKSAGADRFQGVCDIENMSEEERFAFWRGELSRCIRCNACRNACPACTCEKCVFDNNDSGVAAKSNANEFEENMFHIIRAFHVAGRCTDCGECSRVCPQNIPLHLLNRKMIKDMNTYYGTYQAGEDSDSEHPLIDFKENDPEPSIVKEGK